MAIEVTTYSALKRPTQGHTPWSDAANANWNQIDAYKVVRNLAVRATNYDAAGNPSGLGYTVAAGDYLEPGNFGTDGPFSSAGPFSGTAAANATTYLYLLADGTLGASTSGYPSPGDEDHIKLARVVTNATNILASGGILDDRYPLIFAMGEEVVRGYMHQLDAFGAGGAASDQVVSLSASMQVRFLGVNASAAARTVTLPAAGGTGTASVVIVKKLDGSGNAVEVVVAGGGSIDGQASQPITAQYGVLRLFNHTSGWYLF